MTLRRNPAQPAPSLRHLELFYRARNRAPEVTVKAPAASDVLSGTRTVRWEGKDPDGDRLTYDLFYAKEGTTQWVKIGTRIGRPVEAEPAAIELQSNAVSSVLPTPRRSIAARSAVPLATIPARRGPMPVSRRPAQVLAKPAPAATRPPELAAPTVAKVEAGGDAADEEFGDAGTTLDWDTRKVPDGRYRLRIVASDAASSPDEPLVGEVVSDAVVVDNTAPRLLLNTAKRVGTAPPAEIAVQDTGNYVASAEYRIDGGSWLAAACADGIFDSADELIRLDPARLPAGKHGLEIRVRDSAGNESVTKLVYRTAPAAAGR